MGGDLLFESDLVTSQTFIPVSRPSINAHDIEKVAEVLREGWVSGDAPIVAEFERAAAARVGRSFAIAVNSGTSALDIAVEASGIGANDEVILPSFTIVSCLNQVLRSGATPIFLDSDRNSWNVTAEAFLKALTPRTRLAIIPHIYGLPAEIDKIETICRERGITLIEDAAEGLGLELGSRRVGGFGDMTILSFYANKVVTTGEGGMVVTDNELLAEQLATLRNLGFSSRRRFVHETAAWVNRMPATAAALGLSQLNRFDELLADQRARGVHYDQLLDDTEGIRLPATDWLGTENIYWVFGVLLDKEKGLDAQTLMKRLENRGIGTRPFFFPLHRQPLLAKFGFQDQLALPIAEELGDFGLYLPSLGTSPEQRVYVAQSLQEALKIP